LTALRWAAVPRSVATNPVTFGRQPAHGLRSDQAKTTCDKNLFGHRFLLDPQCEQVHKKWI
jgi:hypothetical protein